MKRTRWGGARAIRHLMLGPLALAGLMLAEGPARAAEGGNGAAGDTGGLLTLLQGSEVNQSQTVEASHAQVCDELSRAGLQLLAVAWTSHDRVMQVFYDAEHNRYVTVSGSSPTWVQVSVGRPWLGGHTLTAE